MNNVSWEAPYLVGGLDVWTAEAIDGIESGERQELSPGYSYVPDMTPGRTPDGTRYDGVMRNLRFNHVSLVPEGRTGRDVYVHDEAPKSNSRKETHMPTNAPPDGSWLDDPRTVKSVLMYLISKLSPADAEELDAQLTGEGTATAMDARLDRAPDLKRDWLKYAPRDRKALRNALRDPRAKTLGLDVNPFEGKTFAEMFPDANRLVR